MTAVALFALLAFMDIVIPMAGITGRWCLSVSFASFMAAFAFQPGMGPIEHKVGLVVVERGLVQWCNIEVAALVIGMAMFAVIDKVFTEAAMITLVLVDVVKDVFMAVAVHAKLVLLFF